MYTKRHFSIIVIYFASWRLALFSLATGSLALFLYKFLDYKWVAIPWLPVSLIGTATAFYVGFKNNQSYDRGWEARKIWGGIINVSRAFASAAKSYINNDHNKNAPVSQDRINEEVRTLVYRHIGWVYTLKHAMGQRTSWEHEDKASQRQRKAMHKNRDGIEKELESFLSDEEIKWLNTKGNKASQLLDKQSQHLARLRKEGLLDDFRHFELQNFITELYNEQGRSERIKNTPFPRQYATTNTIFILIFAILLPFGMLSEFLKLGEGMLWMVIPFNLVVSWVFTLMEYTGDFSENPFEGLINDVPLRSISKTIEIDLKDMLGEKDLPEREKPIIGVLY